MTGETIKLSHSTLSRHFRPSTGCLNQPLIPRCARFDILLDFATWANEKLINQARSSYSAFKESKSTCQEMEVGNFWFNARLTIGQATEEDIRSCTLRKVWQAEDIMSPYMPSLVFPPGKFLGVTQDGDGPGWDAAFSVSTPGRLSLTRAVDYSAVYLHTAKSKPSLGGL
ncbi:hypothetical protein CPC08DRAFT_770171 [Agrocybe pediades]|nr:hypothetical protein CPC08DRAFT_770171 [Agrocybe pediades]